MTQLEDDIMDYVKSERGATCVALFQLFGQGNAILINSSIKNVVCAFGMSDELAEAINHLLDQGELVDIPCNKNLYEIDGATLDLPIVDQFIPVDGYETIHWQPILYTAYEDSMIYLEEIFAEYPEELAKIKERLDAKRASN
jgi:hypothetical protein